MALTFSKVASSTWQCPVCSARHKGTGRAQGTHGATAAARRSRRLCPVGARAGTTVPATGKAHPSKKPPPHHLLHPPRRAPPWGRPPGPGRSPAGERQEESLGEMEQRWRLRPMSMTVPDAVVDATGLWDPPHPRSTRKGRRCGRARRTAGTLPACSAPSPTAGCCPWGCSCPTGRGQSGTPRVSLHSSQSPGSQRCREDGREGDHSSPPRLGDCWE